MHLNSRAAIALLGLFILACTDLPSNPGETNTPRPEVSIVTGNQQSGEADSPLTTPLRVHVVDSEGRPLANVRVSWITEVWDEVDPSSSLTDANGDAETQWTPRAAGSERTVRARVGSTEVEFVAEVEATPIPRQLTPVALETYDGSGEVVHPDVVHADWLGARSLRMMAITPYPGGDDRKENPSVYFNGFGSEEWLTPSGVTNPVVPLIPGQHLSDPDMVVDPQAKELRLYYRSAGVNNALRLVTSRDGVNWSAARLLLTVPNHEMVSPAIVRRSATEWEMWSVNSGVDGCIAWTTTVERRTSRDGITWSAPKKVAMAADGQQVWHLEVQYVAELAQYVAVYSVKPRTNCSASAMYVSTSSDGINWQPRSQPLLERGAIREFNDIVYRSTFEYDADRDEFTFWHSGASYFDQQFVWRMATERRSRDAVLNPPAALSIGPRRSRESTAPPLLIAP